MKTISALFVLAAAGTALAAGPSTIGIDRSTMLLDNGLYTIQATPYDTEHTQRSGLGTVYESMGAGSGFQAFGAASGPGGFDDYTSTAPGNITLGEFQFVGGVTAAGGVVFFDFFDSAQNFVDGFGVQLPQAGNFIYTITLNTPIVVPNAGILQAFFNDDAGVGPFTSGQWFLSDAAPTVGSSDPSFGSLTNGLEHRFALVDVPAPGAIALMGLAGFAASRRRR
ncbi:MAG: PEP-CTERM sorting domain-containing protein [Phycisphaeraceae bacterium]|nr:MAG: PEP-CTERM sorting domain-containing protein [Phycisphaeraceae bacterium]